MKAHIWKKWKKKLDKNQVRGDNVNTTEHTRWIFNGEYLYKTEHRISVLSFNSSVANMPGFFSPLMFDGSDYDDGFTRGLDVF